MRTAVANDPLSSDILDELIYTGVLSDGADGNADRVVEV